MRMDFVIVIALLAYPRRSMPEGGRNGPRSGNMIYSMT